jgi:chaperonin GroES
MIKIRPMTDHVVIRRKGAQTKSAGGIIIPESAKKKEQLGVVVALGTGAVLASGQPIPIDLDVGDEVLFYMHGGTEIEYEGETYLFVRENDVLGVTKPADPSKLCPHCGHAVAPAPKTERATATEPAPPPTA